MWAVYNYWGDRVSEYFHDQGEALFELYMYGFSDDYVEEVY